MRKGAPVLLAICVALYAAPYGCAEDLGAGDLPSPASSEEKLTEEARRHEAQKQRALEEERKAAADRARPEKEREELRRLELERRTKATTSTLPSLGDRAGEQLPRPGS